MGASFTIGRPRANKREGNKMKKRIAGTLLALFAALCLVPAGAWAESGGISIDEVNFPDKIFRESYVATCDTDSSGDLSAEEIAEVTKIDCGGSEISSLKGIEFFTALKELDCAENELTELDLSKNTALKDLDCGGNALTALNLSKNTALTELSCDENQIASLDLSNNKELDVLYCDQNALTSLDLSANTKLTGVSCEDNELASLTVTNSPLLTWLYCDGNALTSLDVSKNLALEVLSCPNNSLTELDLRNNEGLYELYCNDNKLSSLDLSNNSYVEDSLFDCSNNSYLIGVDADNCFDLSELPGSFDASRVDRWYIPNGAGSVVDGKLKVSDGTKYVTYDYNCSDSIYVSDFTLYIGYAVTFDTDGGSQIASQTVARESSATRPDDPSKTGCVFAGWYTDKTYTEEYDFSSEVTKATTIYAKWVADADAPVISGIEDGKTYCAAQKVTVTDEHLASVTVNGTEVELDNDGSFTLAPAAGEQEVVATDKAGNTTTVTVTVNDGHTPETIPGKDATCTEDGLTEGEKCSVCGVVLKAQQGIHATGHKGGTATCAHKAKCETCGEEYGEFDATNHEALTHVAAKEATTSAEGNIEYWYCSACGKCFSDAAGTKEISQADTVTPKKSDGKKDDEKKSDKKDKDGKKALPKTGDNAMAQVAALLAAGALAIGAALVTKKRTA